MSPVHRLPLVIVALAILIAVTRGAAAQDIAPIESTIAYQLLKQESNVRELPPGAFDLLRVVLDDATRAAAESHRHPSTRVEALEVLQAIQLALVKHNFLQPQEEKDWPDTIGIAFKPLQLSKGQIDAILSFPDNVSRRPYVDVNKPLYFVDCDMGAQLFLAVAQRLQWRISLVEIPQHDFVRWQVQDNIVVNWDWTHGASLSDDEYPGRSDDFRLAQLYLRNLTADEARAYYVGLIASWATHPEDAERLFVEAVKVLPHHPLTLNNFAWLYATSATFKSKSHLAVAYALEA